MMQLSRPQVLKLIVEERFNNVLGRDGGILLIPQSEVCRVWSTIAYYDGAFLSLIVVRMTLPRITPRSPRRRISRSTVHRAAVVPSRAS